MSEVLSIFAKDVLTVSSEVGSLGLLRLVHSELSTGVVNSESLVFGIFGFVVDMFPGSTEWSGLTEENTSAWPRTR